MSDPSPDAIAELLDAGDGILKIVTLAPELHGGLAAIRRLAEAGVLVSVGHSDARAGQVAAAADAGARMVTHLFNAQPSLHHREPGLPGQALADPRLTSGLIVDGHHVAAEVCAIAFAAAPGRICLVTDAAACAGMPPGRVPAGRRANRAPPRRRQPPPRPRQAGRLGAADGRGRNEHGPGRRGSARGGHGRDTHPGGPYRPAELGRIAPGAQADLAWLGRPGRRFAGPRYVGRR